MQSQFLTIKNVLPYNCWKKYHTHCGPITCFWLLKLIADFCEMAMAIIMQLHCSFPSTAKCSENQDCVIPVKYTKTKKKNQSRTHIAALAQLLGYAAAAAKSLGNQGGVKRVSQSIRLFPLASHFRQRSAWKCECVQSCGKIQWKPRDHATRQAKPNNLVVIKKAKINIWNGLQLKSYDPTMQLTLQGCHG